MKTETNTYFSEKKAILEAYWEAREALNRQKDAINWDDREARRAISVQLEQMTCPLTNGEIEAVRAWDPEAETFVATDHLWTKDIHDFAACLRAAGVETFLFTDKSTALVESIPVSSDWQILKFLDRWRCGDVQRQLFICFLFIQPVCRD